MPDFVDYRSKGTWHPSQVELREVVNGESRNRGKRLPRTRAAASSVIVTNELGTIVYGQRQAQIVQAPDGSWHYKEKG